MERLDVIVALLEKDGVVGRGEAAGVDYLNDDVASMIRQIDGVRPFIESGIIRETLLKLLPREVRATLSIALCGTWRQSKAAVPHGK